MSTRRLVLLAAFVSTLAAAEPAYFPPRGDWQRAEPAAAGVDAAKLAEAVAYALARDNPAPRDQALALAQTERLARLTLGQARLGRPPGERVHRQAAGGGEAVS